MNSYASPSKRPIWLIALMLLTIFVSGCSGGSGGQDPILGAGGIALLGPAPTVTAVAPVNNALAVPINTKKFIASFSKAMDPTTLTATSFTLACPAGTPVAGGAVTYLAAGNVATLTIPAVPNLPIGTVCTATITTAAKDTTGIPLASNFVWTFTTGVAADLVPPTVSSTSPLPNATGVATNSLVTASFSEAMDPSTIIAANFTLACPAATAIAGTVSYAVNGNVAIFRPTSNLPVNTACTATVTTGVKDLAGNSMAAPFTWTFTTGASPDTTAPTVIGTGAYGSTGATSGATGLPVNRVSTAIFSEPMDPLTINNLTFTLTGPGTTPVVGTVTYSGTTATFTPAANLLPGTLYTSTITTGAKDLAGNALASNYVWSWTTAVTADVTAPTVTATNPVNLAVGVCTNKTINATFSEAMDPLTINAATFTLSVTGGAAVVGVVAYDSLTNIATFRPVVNLIGVPATNYTATIKGGASGVKDVSGNALAADKVTTFTTNASTCTTAPVLGAAAPFGGFGGSATLTNDGLNTVINGDVGVLAASTKITGLRDSGGNVYTITTSNNGFVNGLIYTLTAPPGSVAGATVTQARADALVAFNSISPASLPGGSRTSGA